MYNLYYRIAPLDGDSNSQPVQLQMVNGQQEDAVRVVLSSDRKTTHLLPTWQDIEVLEPISKALSPIAELTDC